MHYFDVTILNKKFMFRVKSELKSIEYADCVPRYANLSIHIFYDFLFLLVVVHLIHRLVLYRI